MLPRLPSSFETFLICQKVNIFSFASPSPPASRSFRNDSPNADIDVFNIKMNFRFTIWAKFYALLLKENLIFTVGAVRYDHPDDLRLLFAYRCRNQFLPPSLSFCKTVQFLITTEALQMFRQCKVIQIYKFPIEFQALQ